MCEAMTDPKQPPLLQVIFDALEARGWTSRPGGGYIDPKGEHWNTLEGAIRAQTMYEIDAQPIPRPKD